MNKLLWKLLKQHISIPQFIGFFFASLFGMLIILSGYQFYRDVLPIFNSEDSFMKSDNLIISKKISTATTISGTTNTFSTSEIDELTKQPFIKEVGKFTSAGYQVNVVMAMNGIKLLNSEFYFESIPDDFVDVSLSQWTYKDGTDEVPIILPKSYIAMYNFGFARTHSLPKISDGVVSMLDVQMTVNGNGKTRAFKGKVIGFSSRINTILVPEKFMKWSNKVYSSHNENSPSRLILKVSNPTDKVLTSYIDDNGYEIENNDMSTEKTVYFLRLVVSLVMIVGLIISILSFYILMLSIYLLVQKNTAKLSNLLLIGYSPAQVARPYQILSLFLHSSVFVISIVILSILRGYYMDVLYTLLPSLDGGGIIYSVLLGAVLVVFITICNGIIIQRKMMKIWKYQRKS